MMLLYFWLLIVLIFIRFLYCVVLVFSVFIFVLVEVILVLVLLSVVLYCRLLIWYSCWFFFIMVFCLNKCWVMMLVIWGWIWDWWKVFMCFGSFNVVDIFCCFIVIILMGMLDGVFWLLVVCWLFDFWEYLVMVIIDIDSVVSISFLIIKFFI